MAAARANVLQVGAKEEAAATEVLATAEVKAAATEEAMGKTRRERRSADRRARAKTVLRCSDY